MVCPPILFLIFNRPMPTAYVFEKIRAAKPSQLFVAADGPRSDRPSEANLCAEARKIAEQVDWPCDVRVLFRETNLGCTEAVSSAITWFFEQVEMGIVLEDDCLPESTFFPYCAELLARYRDDERVMLVGGTNLFGERKSAVQSYYLSLWGGTWGWASWRRAWSHFDRGIKQWPKVLTAGVMSDLFPLPALRRHWEGIFQRVYDGNLTGAWDYEWLLSCWLQRGYRIVPEVNLITNIGFGFDGTHCTSDQDPLALIPMQPLTFPLRHPPFMLPNVKLESDFEERFYGALSMPSRVTKLKAKIFGLCRTLRPRGASNGD